MDNRAESGRCVSAVWAQCGRSQEAQALWIGRGSPKLCVRAYLRVKCDWASVEAGTRKLRSLRSEWGGHSPQNRWRDTRGFVEKVGDFLRGS